ncbi:hypothetical protein [Candidatus Formimonas warabiya]|nr:hypothetical protein [Candidatus Formimonas warabiya]
MKKRIGFILTLIIILAGLFGCGEKITLEDMETVTYHQEEGGYSITIPKAWEKKTEDADSVSFVSKQPATSFNLVYEIGGYDYYSLDKLAEEVVSSLGKKIENLKIVDHSKSGPDTTAFQFVAQGIIPKEQEVLVKGVILEPYTGVRYYLLFTAGIKDYRTQNSLFDDIAGSFKVNKSDKELYEQITVAPEEQEQGE